MNPALFVAAVAGAGWGIIGAACAMPWFHEAAWVPAWFGPVAGLLLARAQAHLAPSRLSQLVVLGAASLTIAAAAFGLAAQITLEAAPLVQAWITGDALTVAGGPAGPPARLAWAAWRAGAGVWSSGLAVALWPLAVLTHVLLARIGPMPAVSAPGRP